LRPHPSVPQKGGRRVRPRKNSVPRRLFWGFAGGFMWIKKGPDGPNVGALAAPLRPLQFWEDGRGVRRAPYVTTFGGKECDTVRILPVLHFSTWRRRIFSRWLDFLH